MSIRRLACLLLCLCVLLCAAPALAAAPTCTVMFYCVGSDLESEYNCATVNIAQMLEAEKGENVTVTLGVGGCGKWQNPYFGDGEFDIWSLREYPGQASEWDGLPAFYETDDVGYDIPWREGDWSVAPTGLLMEKEYGQRSMTDPDTLRDFIEYSRNEYPADRYILILWDHGGGPAAGFGVDEMYPDSMLVPAQIREAIDEVGIHFDMIGFDACLMGSWEVALQLSGCGDILVASEESVPAWGWDDVGWLELLGREPDVSAEELGRRIVDDYIDGTDPTGQDGTLAVINLAALREEPLEALDGFSLDMEALLREGGFANLSQARAGAKYFADEETQLVDLIDLARRAGGDSARALTDALEGVILYSRATQSVENANGLSVYFPYGDPDAVDALEEIYEGTGAGEGWQRLMQEFASMMMGGQSASSGSTMLHKPEQSGNISAGGGWLQQTYGWVDETLVNQAEQEETGLPTVDGLLPIEDSDGEWVLRLTDEEWDIVTNEALCVFLDDGEGYIDLGNDDAVTFGDEGELMIDFDYTWVALDGNIVPFYSGPYTQRDDGYFRYTGYVPCNINAERSELWLAWDSNHDGGYVTGYCPPYDDESMRRGVQPLVRGDVVEPLCDYYDYDFEYDDEYILGDAFTVQDEVEVTYEDVSLDYDTVIFYRLTDIYCTDWYTEPVHYTE